MFPRARATAALIAILTLLYSQLAVSAFACPRSIEAASQAAPLSHCAKVVSPNLCDRHCDYGSANVGSASPDITPDVLALPLPWRVESPSFAVRIVPVAEARTPRSHSPPPLALFGALRI